MSVPAQNSVTDTVFEPQLWVATPAAAPFNHAMDHQQRRLFSFPEPNDPIYMAAFVVALLLGLICVCFGVDQVKQFVNQCCLGRHGGDGESYDNEATTAEGIVVGVELVSDQDHDTSSSRMILSKTILSTHDVSNEHGAICKQDDHNYKTNDTTTTMTTCSICLVELRLGDEAFVAPTCRHVFHFHCMEAWVHNDHGTVSRRRSNKDCPNCRTQLK